MKLFNLFSTTIFILLVNTISAKKIYVNNNATVGDVYTTAVGAAGNNGTTTATPKLTLAQAYGIAVAGDTIYVDKGTYNDVSLNFTISLQGTIVNTNVCNFVGKEFVRF